MPPFKLPPNVVAATGSVLRLDGRLTAARLANGAEVPLPSFSAYGREGSFRVRAGEPVEVHLPEDSLQGFRDAFLNIRYNGTEERIPVTNKVGAFQLPDDASGKLKLGFEVIDQNGASYDIWTPAQDGWITPREAATVLFDNQSQSQVEGTLRAGDRLRLAYDSRRLEEKLGDSAAELTAKVSFNGRPPLELPLSVRRDNAVLADPTFLPEILIPYDAKTMEVWFEGRSGERLEHDSNFGRNFSFDLAGPRPNSDPGWKRELLARKSFPNLKAENFDVIGPRDPSYDCFAASLGTTTPTPVPSWNLDELGKAYAALGFKKIPLDQSAFEPGVERIAIYAVEQGGRSFFRHVARMGPDGKWISKLGWEHLIQHDELSALEGGPYGHVARIYARPVLQ